MSRLSRLAPRDLDALSAYADGALSPAERLAVEKRLEQDPALRQALQDLRTTSALLRALPQVRAPRSFTLTPEMAGMRSGWLRTPFLQLATALAVVAFVITVGADVLGGQVQSAAFRAAAPAQELAMEAPAEVAAADALEAGAVATVAETALAEKTVADETAPIAPAPMEMLAATPTAEVQAEQSTNREAPTVGGAAALPPAPPETATAAPALEIEPTVSGECEVCGPDLVLPTSVPPDQDAATLAPEEAPPTEEIMGQMAEPSAEGLVEAPAPEARARAGLPALRWLEISLGAIAVCLGAITLWARRRAR